MPKIDLNTLHQLTNSPLTDMLPGQALSTLLQAANRHITKSELVRTATLHLEHPTPRLAAPSTVILNSPTGKPINIGSDGMIISNDYQESEEELRVRLAFESSHPYRLGDKVIILASDYNADELGMIDVEKDPQGAYIQLSKAFVSPYKGQVATVSRIATSPATGPCIRVECGGVGLNIWHPNDQLIPATEIGRMLYE